MTDGWQQPDAHITGDVAIVLSAAEMLQVEQALSETPDVLPGLRDLIERESVFTDEAAGYAALAKDPDHIADQEALRARRYGPSVILEMHHEEIVARITEARSLTSAEIVARQKAERRDRAEKSIQNLKDAADHLSLAESAGVQIIRRLDDETRKQLLDWIDGYHL